MKKLVLIILGLGVVTAVLATVPMKEGPYPYPPNPYPLYEDSTNPLKLRFNYLYEFAQIAEFCASWQLDDPDSADHGGMIEAETGELADVIQTDNTQEAIWVWARYCELTGDTSRFADNIDKAWFYCENFPAWEEEGSAGDDYYRAHNCAWGLAAEERFREVYADESYAWYRDTCADFLKTSPSLSMYSKIDRFVMGWCAGWLYHHGEEMEDAEARDSACWWADTLLNWIENITPEYALTQEGWAMSAGTMVWGISNSAFKRDSMRGVDWIADNGTYLDTFQTWRNVDYYSWDNSWNVGYANGHGAMYDVSGDEAYARHHRWLTHKLLSYDTDDDGGIPATTQDADTTDMTWVSLYLAMMGLDRLIGEVYEYDAGALKIVGLHDGDQIEAGTRMDLIAVVSNYGRALLSNVQVTLSGGASGSGNSDLDFLESDTLTLVSDWEVTDSAVLELSVAHPADQNPENDTYLVRLNKAAIEEGIVEKPVAESSLHLEIASLSGPQCRVSYSLPPETHGNLGIYDVCGARVQKKPLPESEGKLLWNLEKLPRGVYYLMLKADCETITRRFILVR